MPTLLIICAILLLVGAYYIYRNLRNPYNPLRNNGKPTPPPPNATANQPAASKTAATAPKSQLRLYIKRGKVRIQSPNSPFCDIDRNRKNPYPYTAQSNLNRANRRAIARQINRPFHYAATLPDIGTAAALLDRFVAKIEATRKRDNNPHQPISISKQGIIHGGHTLLT